MIHVRLVQAMGSETLTLFFWLIVGPCWIVSAWATCLFEVVFLDVPFDWKRK